MNLRDYEIYKLECEIRTLRKDARKWDGTRKVWEKMYGNLTKKVRTLEARLDEKGLPVQSSDHAVETKPGSAAPVQPSAPAETVPERGESGQGQGIRE